jgi:hypothetical protein
LKELGPDLAGHGLECAIAPLATGSSLRHGRATVFADWIVGKPGAFGKGRRLR